MNSPTTKIREDSMGSGFYGASRGHRAHAGIDWEVKPDTNIKCPWEYASYLRPIYPYQDLKYRGGVYEVRDKGNRYFAVIYYMNPMPARYYNKGDVIGTAQDISDKYGKEMKPHIHIEMYIQFNYLRLIDEQPEEKSSGQTLTTKRQLEKGIDTV